MGILVRWSARRGLARGAVAGLGVGLTMLALLTLWTTGAVRDTTAKVRAVNDVSAHWSAVFTHLMTEEAALRDYLATGGTAVHRPALEKAVGSAASDLDWLERQGGSVEAAHVQMIRPSYNDYGRVIAAVLGAGNNVEQLADYGRLAAVNFGPLRDQVVANVDRQQRELAEFLKAVDRENATIRWGTVLVLLFSTMCCIASAVVLVTYQRQAERETESSRRQAMHDALTGLANRQLLAERIRGAVDGHGPAKGTVGLLLVDLDRFKEVNDTLGHHCGDMLLQEVAQRLNAAARPEDTVARLGGDEFAVLLPDLAPEDDLLKLAEVFRQAIQQPVVLNGVTVDFGASVGAACFPTDSSDAQELLQHADIAMYVAKRGGCGVNIYDPARDDHNPATFSLVGDLRRGIDSGEIRLCFEPRVSAADHTVLGAQARVYWQHPRRGLLPEEAFMPFVESGDVMAKLVDEVLRLAVRQMGEWVQAGWSVPLSVMITAQSLMDPTLPVRVSELLDQWSVPADSLTLACSERAVCAQTDMTASALRRMKALGVRVCVAGLGSAGASLACLRDTPADEVTLDETFVSTVATDSRNRALVKALIEAADGLGLRTVACGVSDAESQTALAALGCTAVQGPWIGEPVPASDLERWLIRVSLRGMSQPDS